MPPFSAFLHLLVWLSFSSSNLSKATSIPNPNCPTKCGALSVPYPFGIGPGCSIGSWYNITCNTTFTPPKPLLSTGDPEVPQLEVLEISFSKLRVKNLVASKCYTESGGLIEQQTFPSGSINLTGSPFTISQENKCTLIGCDDVALVVGGGQHKARGCKSKCSEIHDSIDQPCSGIGCCRIGIQKGLNVFTIILSSVNRSKDIWSFNPCSFAFLGDQNRFLFSKSDLGDPSFAKRIAERVPLVLDWKIGNQSCSNVEHSADYACQQNSKCTDADDGVGGYICNCVKGYQGNPYVSSGCLGVGGDGTLANYFIVSTKEGHLFDILEPRVKREGSFEQINDVAELVMRCLELEGEARPTMRQVVIKLERVQNMMVNQGSMEQEYDDCQENNVSSISEE